MKRAISLKIFLGLTVMLASLSNIGATANAACSPLPSDKGQASYTVNIPNTGSYRVWSRIYSPSSNNNGFYMQVDQTYCQITVGDSASIPAGTFTWVNYQNATPSNLITLSLSAGNHNVTIAGLDPSVGVDRMMFLTDFNCVPTGNGSNCIATAAPTTPANPVVGGNPTTPSPIVVGTTNDTTPVAGVVNLQPSGPDSAISTDYTVDGKPVLSNTLDTTTLTDGKHTVVAVTRYADGTTKTQTSVITTQNFPTFWQLVGNLWNRFWWIVALIIVALIAVFVYFNRRGIFSEYYAFFARLRFMWRDRKHKPAVGGVSEAGSSPYFDNSLNRKDK
jgi:hypothetical protein